MFGALSDNPYYRQYWFGNQANTLMWPMQAVANGYLAYTLTDSATALGVVSLAAAVPQLLFSPLGGVLADRLEKRKLLLLMQGVLCLLAADDRPAARPRQDRLLAAGRGRDLPGDGVRAS